MVLLDNMLLIQEKPSKLRLHTEFLSIVAKACLTVWACNHDGSSVQQSECAGRLCSHTIQQLSAFMTETGEAAETWAQICFIVDRRVKSFHSDHAQLKDHDGIRGGLVISVHQALCHQTR